MARIHYTPEDLSDHDAVAAIIKDDKGNILMQEHVKYGFWTVPIGKAKKGQSVEAALREELAEECGIDVTSFKIILSRKYNYSREGHDVNLTSYLFEISDFIGTIINNEPNKHKQQIFIPIRDVAKLPFLSDMTLLYLETLGIRRKAKT